MKVWPQNISSAPFCIVFRGKQLSEKMVSRRIGTYVWEIWKFIYMDFGNFICSKIIVFELKWVHMPRYERILKQDGAIWLKIISNPLLTPKRATKIKKWSNTIQNWLASCWDNLPIPAKLHMFCLFSLVGQWLLFNKFEPVLCQMPMQTTCFVQRMSSRGFQRSTAASKAAYWTIKC